MRRVVGKLRAALQLFARLADNHDLRNVELAFLGFNAVEYGTWIAILLYAYRATGPTSVGIVALVQLVPSAVFAPVAASLGDRMPRQRFLMLTYAAELLTTGLVAAAMLLGLSPLLVYAVAGVDAAAYTMTRPAQAALLPSLAERPEELTAANGLSSFFEGAGVVAGPLGAAAILAFASPTGVFLAASFVLAISVALSWRVRPRPSPIGETQVVEVRDSTFEGFRFLAREREPRLIVGLLSARMVVIGALDVLFVLMALELFHAGESGAGYLNASLGAGGMLGGAVTLGLVGRRRLGPVLLLGAAAFGACFVVIGVLPSEVAAPALIAAGAMGLSLMDATGRTLLQRVASDETLARVFGVLEGLAMAALGVGSIMVPALVAGFGLRGAIVTFGVLLPALALLSIPGVRRIDAKVDVPEREIALLTKVRMFAPLRPPVLESLARRSSWLRVSEGAVVMAEGDHGDRYYVLASGRLDVTRAQEHVASLDEPGDGVGEIALLFDSPRTATVTAGVDSLLLVLERSDFLAAVTGHPEAARRAEGVAAERMPTTEEIVRSADG